MLPVHTGTVHNYYMEKLDGFKENDYRIYGKIILFLNLF